MKKLSLFFTSALILGLSSCSKDDSSESSFNAAALQGKWNFNTERTLIDGVEIGPAATYSGNANDCSNDYLEFNANNISVWGDFESNQGECDLFLYDGTYSVNGNTINLISEGESFIYNVVSHTATTMTVQDVYTFEGSTYIDEFTFVKVQ